MGIRLSKLIRKKLGELFTLLLLIECILVVPFNEFVSMVWLQLKRLVRFDYGEEEK